jgi:glycogen operon protein
VHPDYLKNANIHDFKIFVQKLHNENIEVILDVVFNHTAEGNEMGPTLCFRGIDNKSYYDLVKDEPRYYNNVTGTGNTLKLSHPNVLRMVTDSLRYWSTEMKVDGFRFDLATALARVSGKFNEQASFLDAIAQDPLLSMLKLIAEPWDTGDKGYQLGRFLPGWAEWNDKYRDTVRRFWRGDPGQLAQLATRLSGSGDIFNRRGRRPWSSINFVTAHDGFTLHDLVSYDHKHNEANQENNQDGTDKNFSWNCGAEGPTRDAEILRLRHKQMRNLLATLFLSQGVPMLLAGDELARTQNGNNNAYCQDNETTWLNWEPADTSDMLHTFTKKLIQLRRDHIVFHRARFFHGDVIPGTDIKDVVWLCPDAREMQDKDWHEEERQCIGVLISGEAGQYHLTDRGEAESDDTYFMILNASEDQVPFTMPLMFDDRRWEIIIDTDTDTGFADGGTSDKATYTVKPHSLLLFRKVTAE